jgi:hypothetical protein
MEERHAGLDTDGAVLSHSDWFVLRMGFAAAAVLVALTEVWDVNGDGQISPREVLLFPVRFLAFPLHLLLSLTPSPVLRFLGLPDAYWPSSAVMAVAVSLPLWGILLIGGLMLEAWLDRSHGRAPGRR